MKAIIFALVAAACCYHLHLLASELRLHTLAIEYLADSIAHEGQLLGESLGYLSWKLETISDLVIRYH